MFKSHSLDVQIIEATNKIIYILKEYSQSQSVTELLTFIHSVDVNNLSVVEAYQFISDLQKRLQTMFKTTNVFTFLEFIIF